MVCMTDGVTGDVALRKESVDRNACIAGRRVGPGLSLSARRAWIEIQGGDWVAVRVEVALRKESVDRNAQCLVYIGMQPVALRKESVDRNFRGLRLWLFGRRSLSARRAWIEITGATAHRTAVVVALRKESVDRNSRLNPYY